MRIVLAEAPRPGLVMTSSNITCLHAVAARAARIAKRSGRLGGERPSDSARGTAQSATCTRAASSYRGSRRRIRNTASPQHGDSRRHGSESRHQLTAAQKEYSCLRQHANDPSGPSCLHPQRGSVMAADAEPDTSVCAADGVEGEPLPFPAVRCAKPAASEHSPAPSAEQDL